MMMDEEVVRTTLRLMATEDAKVVVAQGRINASILCFLIVEAAAREFSGKFLTDILQKIFNEMY